jgi:hypothetical protein
MQITGTLLDIEHKAGTFYDDNGRTVDYDFVLLHVLCGREVLKVRLPKEVNALDLSLAIGDTIDVDVTVPSNTKIMFHHLNTGTVAAASKSVFDTKAKIS